MSRIFISHSSANNSEAIALRDWLMVEGWSDLFLDLDPQRGIAAGERWERSLNEAARRCEAVLFLISKAWLSSRWCMNELTLARRLNKRLFGLLIEEGLAIADLPHDVTSTWQLLNLATGRDHHQFRVKLPVTGEEVHVTYSLEGLNRLKNGLQRAGLHASYFNWPPEQDPKRAPYRGLRPLEAEDAGIFFGREAPIIEAIDRLRGQTEAAPPRLMVILGASGAGKSSFLRAGLLPRLGRDPQTFMPLPPVRPERGSVTGEGLVDALARGCEAAQLKVPRADIRAAIEGGGKSLRPLLKRLQSAVMLPTVEGIVASKPPIPVIAIDQGEELFLTDRKPLLPLLRELLITDDPAVIVLVTIRSDNYELLQTAPELEGVHQQMLNLPPMPKGSYAEVVKGPIQRLNGTPRALKLEEALVDALLADVEGGGAKDALPLLAFTLERLFQEYGATGSLTLDHYTRLGRVKGSIEAAIERSFTAADSDPRIPQDSQARLALLRRALIPWLAGIDPDTGAPRRRIARLSEIPVEARPLIDLLVDQRLLSTDIADDTGEGTIEPAHEALLRQWGMLQGWLDEDFESLATLEGVKRATRDWAANAHAPEFLSHSSGRLEAAERAASREDLARIVEPTEREYLRACRDRQVSQSREAEERLEREKAQVRRTKRLQRRFAYLLGIASIVGMLLFSGAASMYHTVTLRDARIAATKAEQAFAIAHFEQAGKEALAGLPARGALPIHHRSTALEAILRNALFYDRLISVLEVEEERLFVRAFSWSNEGSRFVTTVKGVARLWDGQTGKPIATLDGHNGPIAPVHFTDQWSHDGSRYVTVAEGDQVARLWNGTTGALIAALEGHQGPVSTAYGTSWSSSGLRLVTVAKGDRTARLWDGESGVLVAALEGHEEPPSRVFWSLDGLRAVTVASGDKVARLWDARTGKLIAALAGREKDFWDTPDQVSWSQDGLRLVTKAGEDRSARLWDGITGTLVTVLEGHRGKISRVNWSKDGSRLVTWAEGDPTARLWDGKTGDLAAELEGHESPIARASWSMDGSRLVTRGKGDPSARLWDGRTGAFIAALKGHSGSISGVSWSPEEPLLATWAEGDRVVRLWDGERGAPIASLEGHKGPISEISWSRNGSRLVTSADGDTAARLWDGKTGGLIASLDGHQGPISTRDGAVWSDDGTRLVTTAERDGVARLWDGRTGVQLAAFTSPQYDISSASWSKDGTRVVAISGLYTAGQSTARLWDASLSAYSGHATQHRGEVTARWSNDEARIVTTAKADPVARLWDGNTGTLIAALEGHQGPVAPYSGAFWSEDGLRLVTKGDADRVARFWNGRTGTLIAVLEGHQEKISRVDWSKDGSRLVTSANGDTATRLWDGKSGTLVAVLDGGPKNTSWILSHHSWVHWSADGARLVTTTSGDSVARLWDGKSGVLIAMLEGHQGSILSALWSDDSSRLVTTGHDDRVARLWDGKTGMRIAALEGHQGKKSLHADWSEDGSRLVTTAGDDPVARLWDGITGTLIAALRAHQAPDVPSTSVFWSPDGLRLATMGDSDRVARLWDGKDGTLIGTLGGHQGKISGIRWSKDGLRLVTSANSGAAQLWDGKTGSLIAVLEGRQSSTTWVSWSKDGSRLVTSAVGDTVVRLWNGRTGALIAVLEGHQGKISGMKWSKDGSRLVTTSEGDRVARLWDTQTGLGVFAFISFGNKRLADARISDDGSSVVIVGDEEIGVWKIPEARVLQHDALIAAGCAKWLPEAGAHPCSTVGPASLRYWTDTAANVGEQARRLLRSAPGR